MKSIAEGEELRQRVLSLHWWYKECRVSSNFRQFQRVSISSLALRCQSSEAGQFNTFWFLSGGISRSTCWIMVQHRFRYEFIFLVCSSWWRCPSVILLTSFRAISRAVEIRIHRVVDFVGHSNLQFSNVLSIYVLLLYRSYCITGRPNSLQPAAAPFNEQGTQQRKEIIYKT